MDGDSSGPAEPSAPAGPSSASDVESGGLTGFLLALGVRRHAAIGLVVGLVVAVAVYVRSVVWASATYVASWYYLALAFTLAVSLGGLVTAALTTRAAIRRARDEA